MLTENEGEQDDNQSGLDVTLSQLTNTTAPVFKAEHRPGAMSEGTPSSSSATADVSRPASTRWSSPFLGENTPEWTPVEQIGGTPRVLYKDDSGVCQT